MWAPCGSAMYDRVGLTHGPPYRWVQLTGASAHTLWSVQVLRHILCGVECSLLASKDQVSLPPVAVSIFVHIVRLVTFVLLRAGFGSRDSAQPVGGLEDQCKEFKVLTCFDLL
uniref:Uncharacterized protein n=1 Tax=Setaria italica TaxID=4555 RepID=K3YAZ9_SETIT